MKSVFLLSITMGNVKTGNCMKEQFNVDEKIQTMLSISYNLQVENLNKNCNKIIKENNFRFCLFIFYYQTKTVLISGFSQAYE